MSSISVTYEEFSASNQALVGSGGPWSVDSDRSQCLSENTSWCDGWCLECQVFPPNSMPAYHPSFNANISVDLSKYGGATTLDYTWSFWPLYCGTNVTAGSSIPIQSRVGDKQYEDGFPAVDFYAFFNGGRRWDDASMISHSASTSLVLGSGNRGYIPLQIAFVMRPLTDSHEEYLNYYVKGIDFRITTPLQTAGPSTSVIAPTSSNSVFTSSNSTTQPILQITDSFAASASSITSSVTVSVGNSSTPSSPTTLPVAVVAGAALGSISFIALLFIAIFLFRRQRKQEKGLMANPADFREAQTQEERPSSDRRDLLKPRWVTRYSVQQPPVDVIELNAAQNGSRRGRDSKRSDGCSTMNFAVGHFAGTNSDTGTVREQSSGSNGVPFTISPEDGQPISMHASSLFSDTPYDPPPTYGPGESNGHSASFSFSPELALYATANRDVINLSLEARLQAAGYLPTDDPSNLTPEEWKNEYGVTTLELRRLQELYVRKRGILTPGSFQEGHAP